MAATETTEAAAAARDATRLESLVCFFFILLIFYYTNTFFRSTYHVETAAATATEARDATRRVSSRWYFNLSTKEGFETRCVSSSQVCFFLKLVYFFTLLISI
jgi:hypothetical protein